MSESKELTQEEAQLRFKQANAKGFINQMIAGSGATAEQAVSLFNKSDEKATRLLQKQAKIRESILAEVSGKTEEGTENLPENLRGAAS